MGSALTEGGSSHLIFEKLPIAEGQKLHKYKVINKRFRVTIGEIRWRGGWRQYVFNALPDIDMSRSCHKEIDTFIDKLMGERKKKEVKRE